MYPTDPDCPTVREQQRWSQEAQGHTKQRLVERVGQPVEQHTDESYVCMYVYIYIYICIAIFTGPEKGNRKRGSNHEIT